MASNRFPLAKQLLHTIEDELSQFELLHQHITHEVKAKDTDENHKQFNLVKQSITNKFDEFLIRLKDLQQILHDEKEINNVRSHWKSRIDQLDLHYKDLYHAFTTIIGHYDVQDKKNQLFFNNTSNSNSNSSVITLYSNEEESLSNSLKLIHQYTEMGQETLTSLNRQRYTLKSAQTKLLNVLNTMGISNTLLNVIKRKDGSNAVLVYSCMLFTILLTIGILYWVK